MFRYSGTKEMFIDIVESIELECEKKGMEKLLDIVEGKVRQMFLGRKVDEITICKFMYQIAFAVTMRYRAKNLK